MYDPTDQELQEIEEGNPWYGLEMPEEPIEEPEVFIWLNPGERASVIVPFEYTSE